MASVINREKAVEIINGTDGGFFTVHFVKLDGSIRKLTGRKGVKKGVKGNPSTVARKDTPFVTVFDIVKHEFRVLNLATLIDIKTRGEVYLVKDYRPKCKLADDPGFAIDMAEYRMAER